MHIYGIHCYITYNCISNNTVVFHVKVKYINNIYFVLYKATQINTQLILRLKYLNIKTEINNYSLILREMFTWKIACVDILLKFSHKGLKTTYFKTAYKI